MIASLRLTGTIVLVLFALILSATFTSCESTTDTPPDDNTVRIGALLALTGPAGPFGRETQAALEVSVDDFNDFLATANSELFIELDSADTESNPARALQLLDEMADRGIKFIIGPTTNVESIALHERAKERGVILLSPSTMITSLSMPNDNFFSMVPDHTIQGAANAAYLKSENITHLIAVRVDDAWGADQLATLSTPFEAGGGSIDQVITYNRTTVDPVAIISQLSAAVASAVTTHGAASVGVVLISYPEGVAILKEASKDATLDKVKWLGSSALERSQLLEQDKEIVSFLQKVHFPCAVFGINFEAAPIWQAVQSKITAKLGHDGDSYSLAAYDALWLAAYTVMDAGSDDDETLREVLIHNSQSYFGASGWTGMDENGNRRDGNFDFWSIRAGLQGFGQWYRSAVYERQDNGQYLYVKKQ